MRKYALIIIILFSSIIALDILSATYAYTMGYPFRGTNGSISSQSKTQNFGMFRKYSSGGEEFHTGIDIQAYPLNHKVHSIAGGTVLYAGWPDSGDLHFYGRTVIIDHGTWRSIYNHLSSIEVATGDYVNEGRVIGQQGGGGIVSGNKSEKAFSRHLHLTIGSIPNSGNDLIKKNLENPIKVGLKQSCGNIKILSAYFIKPGLDSSGDFRFGTSDDKAINKNKNGTVRVATDGYNEGYGKYILIDDTDGTSSRYCHLSVIDPKLKLGEGKTVTVGQIIGYSGDTGMAQGHPHLHFEYWNASGKKIDPITGTSLTDGLDQPNNGNAYIYKGIRYRRGEKLDDTTNGVYLVTPGIDGKFDGNDDEMWFAEQDGKSIVIPSWKEGEPIRIVLEGYDKIVDDSGKERSK